MVDLNDKPLGHPANLNLICRDTRYHVRCECTENKFFNSIEPCTKHPDEPCQCICRSIRDLRTEKLLRLRNKEKKSDNGGPKVKRFQTGWANFLAVERRLHCDLNPMATRNEGDPSYKKSIKELVRGIATKWRTLTEEERKPYECRA